MFKYLGLLLEGISVPADSF